MELNTMNVKQLQELAAELGVKGRSKMKKAEIIDAIESAQETADILADEETMAAIAEAESEQAPCLAEYDAEDTGSEEEPDAVKATQIIFKNLGVAEATAIMIFEDGSKYFAQVERFGHKLTIRERPFMVRPGFKVKAISFDRLARKWAKALGVWNTEIRITKEF